MYFVNRLVRAEALFALAAIMLMLTACHSTADHAIAFPIPESPNHVGIHLLLDDGRNHWPVGQWPVHIEAARQITGEGGYVVQLVRLDDLDVERWQIFMDLCAANGLIPILRLATTFDHEKGTWVAPPASADGSYRKVARQYAGFITAVRWATDTHYVIVGNEPNHGNEWGGRPDPAAYARFLIAVAEAVHAADPQARVLNAALDAYSPHTGSLPFADGFWYVDAESFMDGMIAAEPDVFSQIDAWASHAYPMGPFSEPPWTQVYQVDYLNDAANPRHVEPPEGITNRGVNGYEWELFKLASYGIEGLPVFITETGWRHSESVDPAAPDNGRPLPDGDTVAIYIDLVLRGNHGRYPGYPQNGWTPWLEDSRVAAVVFFALDGLPSEWGHTNWLELDPFGFIQGSYPFADAP